MHALSLSTRATSWRRRFAIGLLSCVVVAGLASCGGKREPDAAQQMTMKPSVTYLHLLRNTPFFTALSTDQLQWVIDHSHEWAADAGAVIATCDHGAADAPYWVLLDGGWKIEYAGRAFQSGHADPGKWFSAAEGQGQACRLVASESSYVMRIERADMQAMLDRQFDFRRHLDAGTGYYRSIFGGGAGAVQGSPRSSISSHP